ncbi:MAG: caspase family protein, partial [Aestuariivirgaceae bacterium]
MRFGLVFTGMVMLLVAAFSAPASAARVALVIGNDRYAALPDLQKAANDARAVAAALEELGFKVFVGENLKRRETNRMLADFEAAIQPGDQAFFFYAGHGVAIGPENYLVPSDMHQPRAGEEGLIRDEAHSVHSLIERVQRKGAASTIFVLDACRDNPFAATGVRSIGSTRGLTRVAAPKGVFVLFSAGTGQAALDRLSDSDGDANSVFTRKLVPLLKTPGLTHVRLAKKVQQQVSALARTVSHDQQPAYYDQIIGEIVLKPAGQQAAAASPAPAGAAQAWTIIQDTTSPGVLKAFIAQFPDSVYAGFARARLDELGEAEGAGSTEQRLVAVEPTQPPAAAIEKQVATIPATAPAVVDRTELVRAIQKRLNWHRCNAGRPDGQ